jgi:hypothetical protein
VSEFLSPQNLGFFQVIRATKEKYWYGTTLKKFSYQNKNAAFKCIWGPVCRANVAWKGKKLRENVKHMKISPTAFLCTRTHKSVRTFIKLLCNFYRRYHWRNSHTHSLFGNQTYFQNTARNLTKIAKMELCWTICTHFSVALSLG